MKLIATLFLLIGLAFFPASAFAQTSPSPVDDVLDDDEDGGYADAEIRVNRLRIQTPDGRDIFRLRGRIFYDAGFLMLDDNYNTVDDDRENRGDLARFGTVLRSARFGAEGAISDLYTWRLEVDFRDEEVRMRGTYIEYIGHRPFRLLIGNTKEPTGLEWMTNRRASTFLERAAPVDAYMPDWAMGIRAEYQGFNYNLMAGAFGSNAVEIERDINQGYSLAGRATFAPWISGRNYLHLGAGATWRQNAYRHQKARGFDKEYQDLRLRTRTGTRALDGRFIGRIDITDVTNHTVYAFESAVGLGPLSISGEYIGVVVERDLELVNFDDPTLNLGGFYVQASYFLTGESRNYRPNRGNFGTLVPMRDFGPGAGPGAWELTARFANINSIDKDYDGGQMDHLTVGLNWYLSREFRVMFNYMYLKAQRANGKTSEGSVLGLRFHLEF